MPIIPSSPSPPLPPPCSAPHCSAPLHPVIPQERREEKHMKECQRNRGAKGFEKVEGGVAGCGCCTPEGGICLDFASIDLFICCLCLYVCVCVSFQTGPSAQCPVSTYLGMGSCYHQCGERAPPSGSSSSLGSLLPLPAQPTPLSDPSSTAGRCCCRSATPTGREKTLSGGKKGWRETRPERIVDKSSA